MLTVSKLAGSSCLCCLNLSQSPLISIMADLEPPGKKKRLSLSIRRRKQEAETSTSRFEATREDELESLSKTFVPKNTSISLNCSFLIYTDWIEHCQEIADRDYKPEDLWLCRDNVSVTKVQARIITIAEEQQLWDCGVLGTSNPTSLLSAVFYYCGLHLCLRGGDEHHSLKLSQFVVKTVENPSATSETIKCLTYNEQNQVKECSLLYNQQARHQRRAAWNPQEKRIKLEKCLSLSTFKEWTVVLLILIFHLSYHYCVILMLLF